MKKIIVFFIVAVIVIVSIVGMKIKDVIVAQNQLNNYNAEFEAYQEKTLYGADVLTIINKAIDLNTTNSIEKNEDGFYIDDDNLALKVELVLLSTDSEGEVTNVTYQMETLEKAGLNEFIASFGITTFECTNIEYNSVGRVSKIQLTQLEI